MSRSGYQPSSISAAGSPADSVRRDRQNRVVRRNADTGDLLLGVDAGQTVTKVVVFDSALTELGTGSSRVALTNPHPRWVERDMDDVWRATAAAIRGALADAGVDGSRVRGVGIVGHNDGLYPVDSAHRPVRAAVTALDTRAHEVIARWRESGAWAEMLELTGQVPYGGSPSALCAWFARHDPAVLDRTSWLLYCKDWLRLCLTGEVATDPSEASAAFTAARTGEYSPRALELYGLTGLADVLPPILPSDAVAGRVLPPAAAETGLRVGTPVVTGAHDVDGTAVGTGVVAPGTLSLVAGTFSINQVVSDVVRTDERWQARTFVRPGHWLNMSTSPSSATNLDWFLRLLGADDRSAYDRVDREVRAALAGPSRLVYHPFLYGSPYGADASAALLGLRGWHDSGQLLRAVLEGVVLGHRVHVDALRDGFAVGDVVRLSGGAARSELWSQMFADALDLRVEITDCAESGARGAAALAGLGVGLFGSLDDVPDLVKVARTHLPEPSRRDALTEAYATFVAATGALRDIWPRLG